MTKTLDFLNPLVPVSQTLSNSEPSSDCNLNRYLVHGKRRKFVFCSTALVASLLNFGSPIVKQPLLQYAFSEVFQLPDEALQDEEDRTVHLFQAATTSVAFIKDIELKKGPKNSYEDESEATLKGTGSGFVWDKFGHIVTNYHVVEKLATDGTGLQRCKVVLVDEGGNRLERDGKLIGFDPSYDLAILKVDIEGHSLTPARIGKSGDLRVGQSCYAIGSPYGYQNTLTRGVVSGLKREIPSPNGKLIRGVIQTDASINAGNSGGPLIDSNGNVIGINTATFTRKGSGKSSGVNFAIPIDSVLRIVPYIIVYGTPYADRF